VRLLRRAFLFTILFEDGEATVALEDGKLDVLNAADVLHAGGGENILRLDQDVLHAFLVPLAFSYMTTGVPSTTRPKRSDFCLSKATPVWFKAMVDMPMSAFISEWSSTTMTPMAMPPCRKTRMYSKGVVMLLVRRGVMRMTRRMNQ
jgi:hypothetical protein